ncbi:NAD(P)H nitroreductase [Algibacillus agarilyticus]|uniref:NAD(P)H nitroreductase n=1 Tax=Algibacillus agarilyticus TaxID=2234133 RepID=UPI000DD08795|nr:NAD(P)H nitroreductase [Algibacillus agarilyticus]
MQALELLLQRNSFNQLMEPAPSTEQLDIILDAAVCVPDHGALKPWRFIVFQDQALCDLGEIFAEAAELQKAAPDLVEKAKLMPLRAPLVIAIIADIKESTKIPRQEQLLTAGCCVHAMQMAAVAQGFDGIWRSGALAYDAHVKQQFKLKAEDEIVGFLYLGTAKSAVPQKKRDKGSAFTQIW